MKDNNLQWKIYRNEYHEEIKLFTSKGDLLFHGNCDALATSVSENIELCLNYGNSQYLFHHTLKKSGNQVVLLPTVREAALSNFFEFRLIGTQIFSIEDLMALWNQLRYESSELLSIPTMNSSDWTLLWLLNIPCKLEMLSVKSLKSWILANTVAEFPEGYPKVTDILHGQLGILGEVTELNESIEPVIAYVDSQDLGLVEWEAVDANKRDLLLLGNSWGIRAKYM